MGKKREDASQHVLDWEFEGDGTWSAYSCVHDDGSPFVWVIEVEENGRFDLTASNRELLSMKRLTYRTLCEAKEACQVAEDRWCMELSE